jgi:hypothetical protein
MSHTLLRFADLRSRGIVQNWATLTNWIEREGFPVGRKLGPNTRVWTETEVTSWLSNRPTDKAPLRGGAKKRAAKKAAEKMEAANASAS